MPAEKDSEGKDTGYSFNLISTSGKNVAATDPIIKRYASWISIALNSQLLLLGQDGVGSLSLADNQTEMLAFVIAAIVDSALDAINEDAVRELVELNGIRSEYAPIIKHGDVETVDLNKLGSFMASMGGAGFITPDDTLEDHLREEAGAPKKEEQEQPAGEATAEVDDDDIGEDALAMLGRMPVAGA